MYIYIPDTYDHREIEKKFQNMDAFVDCQKKYKAKFEEHLYNLINFNELYSYIREQGVSIPRVFDEDYNFYHNDSRLNSNYFFLRNNIHIENLTEEDIKILSESEQLDDEFISRTFKSVLYENGDESFFGTPKDESLAKSDSIVIEFAYDLKKCDSLENINSIRQIATNSFDFLSKEFTTKSDYNVSFVVYDAIQDLFVQDNNKKNIV